MCHSNVSQLHHIPLVDLHPTGSHLMDHDHHPLDHLIMAQPLVALHLVDPLHHHQDLMEDMAILTWIASNSKQNLIRRNAA